MDNLTHWINPRIPVEYIVGSFIVLCIVLLVGFIICKDNRIKRIVLYALLMEYYFLVLCTTVICRTAQITKRIELIPFYKYLDIWNKTDHPHDLIEVTLNIALFVPIGLLLSGIVCKKKWWHIAAIGCGLSLIIELLQLATGRGLCETDDLIHNTLGCMIGYGMFKLLKKGISKE